MNWPFRKHVCGTENHRFEARYDEVPNDKVTSVQGSAQALRHAMYYRVYVRDVCVRCGRTIERLDVKFLGPQERRSSGSLV